MLPAALDDILECVGLEGSHGQLVGTQAVGWRRRAVSSPAHHSPRVCNGRLCVGVHKGGDDERGPCGTAAQRLRRGCAAVSGGVERSAGCTAACAAWVGQGAACSKAHRPVTAQSMERGQALLPAWASRTWVVADAVLHSVSYRTNRRAFIQVDLGGLIWRGGHPGEGRGHGGPHVLPQSAAPASPSKQLDRTAGP